MKALFRILIMGLLALGVSASARAQEEPVRIVVYGDSLTSGYELQPEQAFPARLERKLKGAGFSNVVVINMSVADATTGDGLERVNALMEQQPDIVILELGTNDAQRGVSIESINNNLATIAGKLAQSKKYVILMGNKAPSSMGYSYDVRFQNLYRSIAAAYKCALYPFALEGIADNPDLNLADGLHPNAKGVKVMADQVYPLVDAAVRWEWAERQWYQQWLQQQQQNQGISALPAPGR